MGLTAQIAKAAWFEGCSTSGGWGAPTGRERNSVLFSISELGPSRTRLWRFGHTNFGEGWIPVPLNEGTVRRPIADKENLISLS